MHSKISAICQLFFIQADFFYETSPDIKFIANHCLLLLTCVIFIVGFYVTRPFLTIRRKKTMKRM